MNKQRYANYHTYKTNALVSGREVIILPVTFLNIFFPYFSAVAWQVYVIFTVSNSPDYIVFMGHYFVSAQLSYTNFQLN